jgi:DNA-binding CsgD family transcriptional regulator
MIPGNWSGETKNTIEHFKNEQNECQHFFESWQDIKNVNFNKIALIAENDYASIGVRYLLSKFMTIRLRTINYSLKIPEEIDSFQPKIVIWIINSRSQFSQKIPDILTIRRSNKSITQLVICNNLPLSLIGPDKIIAGITLISSFTTISDMEKIVSESLTFHKPTSVFFQSSLSRRQFKVILCLAKGKRINEISKCLHLDSKTVLTHKYLATNKLKLTDRKEKAWAMQAISQIARTIPCLEKRCDNKHHS